jgi:NAD(P)-dependent dehydrogenase (short-subunit alcohol dehydrogenase family)
MVNRLSGRIAVVTGASSGMRRAIALAYADEGAAIVCADLQPDARVDSKEVPISTHDLIIERGGKATFGKTDVQKEDEIEALVASAVKEFGRLDMFVSLYPYEKPVEQNDEKNDADK